MTQETSRSSVEERTQSWMAERFVEGIAKGTDPVAAVFGPDGQPCHLSRYHFQAMQRKLKIFRWLDRIQFESFIDIGSGFDFYPYLVNQRYGVPAYYSDLNHGMNMPFDGERSGKIDHAVTLNVIRLPFADDEFDVVIASEVLEHLVRPVEAIAELLRITRRCLIMTSLEALSPNRWQRFLSHFRVDVRIPHIERNFFLLPELEAIFGAGFHHENLLFAHDLPVTPFAPDSTQEAVYGAIADRASLRNALCHAVRVSDHRPGAMGVLLVKSMPGAAFEPSPPDAEERLADWLIDQIAAFERSGFVANEKFWNGTAQFPDSHSPVASSLLSRVRCPDCLSPLDAFGSGARCRACEAVFEGSYGVPILQPKRDQMDRYDEARSLEELCGGDDGRRQVVRRVMRRLRRNEALPSALRQRIWKVVDRLPKTPR